MPTVRSAPLAAAAALLVAGCGRPDMGTTGPPPEPEVPALEAVAFDRLGGGTILFQRIAPGANGVGIVGLYRVDGSARRSEVFLAAQPVLMPVLAPDGERIAFVAYSGTAASAYDVYVARLDATGVRRLSADEGNVEMAPSWTPDGAVAYALAGLRTVAGQRVGDVVRQSATSAVGERELLATVPSAGSPTGAGCPTILGRDDTPVAVSATGTIVFVCDRFSLYAAAPGAAPVRLYEPPPPMPGGAVTELASPAWSPDGRRLAFLEIRRGTGGDTTLVRRIDAATPGALAAPAPVRLLAAVPKLAGILFEWSGTHTLCWLPGGVGVAFTAPESDRTAHVYVADAEGGATQLTTAPDAFDRNVSCRGT